MPAPNGSAESGTAATPVIAALRTEVFDELTAKLGATNDVQRAQLLQIDRSTIWRMRERITVPGLTLAMRIAEQLGTTVDELFEQVAA